MPLLLRAMGRRPALTHPVLDRPLRAFMRLWFHLSPLQIREAQGSLKVVRETGRWPLLFLYSRGDALVRHELVTAFVDSVRASDRSVEVRQWEDSEHVRHMLRHRNEYFDAIAALLERTLPSAEGA
jgi:hypothetical protein